ncbi:HET-domain-containing protein [Xylaria sp. FL0933]|nr:HET-domain-containing protein [Xylaria sp. FL0933]
MEFSKVISAPPGQVCTACANIAPHRTSGTARLGSPFERVDDYPSYPGIRATAEAGCTLCRLLYHAITVMLKPNKPSERQLRSAYWRIEDPADLQRKFLAANWDRKVKVTVSFSFSEFRHRPGVTGPHDPTETETQEGVMIDSMLVEFSPATARMNDWEAFKWGNSELQFYVYDSLDMNSKQMQYRRILPSLSTLSEANVATIQKWIGDCMKNHTMCSVDADPWVPTRLVKIVPVEDTFTCQIIETADDHGFRYRNESYAALTHMWGDVNALPPLRLIDSNYQQFKENIDLPELPRNFSDAIQVCLRLGIQYLWIDSLCIIQDSDPDWRHEAAQMHLVYQHAVVTIAATQATSSHDGFLQRDIDKAPACKIPYYSPVGNAEYMVLRWQEWPMADHRLSAVNGAEWNTRGWTMQERSLSTRLLHFCKNKIFFECRGALESEENEPPDENELGTIPMWPQPGTESIARLHARWRVFVAQYSERNLTKSSDKLVAIQSVATRMAGMTGQKYIPFAGMWSENLEKELLWNTTFGSGKRYEPWLAPTWSWASLDGTVVLPELSTSRPRSVPASLSKMVAQYPFEVIRYGSAGADLVSSPNGYLEARALWIEASRIQRRGKVGIGWGPYDVYSKAHDSDEKVFAHARLDVETSEEFSLSSSKPMLYMHVNVYQQPTGLLLRECNAATALTGQEKKWARVGVATLFDFGTGKLLMDNPFEACQSLQTFILV